MATINGTSSGDTLKGTNESDIIYGLGGNDTLGDLLLLGEDTMYGGQGNDTYNVNSFGDQIIEIPGEGTDTIRSQNLSWILGSNIENLTILGTIAANGTGNSLNNVLIGNIGVNVLDGGAGADTMTGGNGDDTYIVDNIGDKITEASTTGSGKDTVRASVNYTLSVNTEDLVLLGSASINGTGNSSGNTITGNDGNNILDGVNGADTMIGGAGNDTYFVNDDWWDNGVGDIVLENTSEGVDCVNSYVNYSLWRANPFEDLGVISNNIENLTLLGGSKIYGSGNDLNNTIIGNTGSNNLSGGKGDDSLIGGNGADFLSGDAGADTLTGISLSDVSLGKGTVDVFSGGNNDSDLFVLGNSTGIFYSDGSTTKAGTGDFAYILDFSNGDRIQLRGNAGNYLVKQDVIVTSTQVNSLLGTPTASGLGLYLDNGTGTGSIVGQWDAKDELVAIYKTDATNPYPSNTNLFTYV
jgi:Ca2+-binding RTX toxin-like protein